jgi:hypothetical protein
MESLVTTGNIRAHKGDIAMELLKDARDLFDKEHYFSAINLAAASAEVLCKLCEMYDKPSPHQQLKDMLKDFHDSNPDFFSKPKMALKSFYAPKNAIKHIDGERDEFIIMNPMMRATLFINQAARAATALGVENKLEIEKEYGL